MNEKNTGGPAFPISPDGAYLPDCEKPDAPPQREFPGHPGMTLRDYFAGQALLEWSGMIELQQPDEMVIGQMKTVSKICYGFADAMIEARNK